MKTVTIDDVKIGDNQPIFIIAEAGVNHNGDFQIAQKMIEIAWEAKANAIKFQTFKAEKLVIKTAEKAKYQQMTTGEGSQYEMLKKLELNEHEFIELKKYAEKKGLIFLSTPFDIDSVNFLDQIGVVAFKIGSGDIDNIPLLKHVARKGKPIIISCGMSNLADIELALNTLHEEGNQDIVLLHCTSSYPANISEVNIRCINTLKNCFKLPIGYSDHTVGITVPLISTACGACIIEKHFTLDNTMEGPDHKSSLEPNELKHMIREIRKVESVLGDGIKKISPIEEQIKKVARKSIVSSKDIQKGEEIEISMINIKRPGTGISPKYLSKILGKKTINKIDKDTLIKWSDFK